MSAQTARTKIDADGGYRTEPIERRAEPERRTPLPGSVDLGYCASLPEWGPQAARVQDVSYTIDAAVVATIKATVEFVDKKLDERDAQIAGLARRLTMAELEAAALKSENASLKRNLASLADEVGDLTRQVKLARAARGISDGASLPSSLVRPKPRAPKRKAAKP